MSTTVRALRGVLLILLFELLEHLKMSILGKIQPTDTVSLKFSEILEVIHRKTEEEESTKVISF